MMVTNVRLIGFREVDSIVIIVVLFKLHRVS